MRNTPTRKKLLVTSLAGVLGGLLLVADASAQGRGEGRGEGRGSNAGNPMRGGGDMMRGGGRNDAGMRVGGGQRMMRDSRNRNVRTGVNVRVRGDVVRVGVRDDRRRWRNARWVNRGWDDGGWDRWGGSSFRVGFGFSDPYYSYGYADPYRSYGYAQPFGYRRAAYQSYAASPACTCAPAAYASWNGGGWNNAGISIGFGTGWGGWGNRGWDRWGWGAGW